MRKLAIVLLLVVAIAATVVLFAQSGRPAAPQVPAQGPRVYVSNETLGEIVVIDPDAGTVVQRIKVGKRPRGLKLSHDGKQLFVALSGSPIAGPNVDEKALPPPDRAADGIGIVDLATNRLVRNLKSGNDPEAFDLSPDGKTLYVSNEDAGEMSIVDVMSGTILQSVKVGGEPEGVTMRPGGREVYVASEADHAAVVVDTATRQVVARITMSDRPRSIIFNRAGSITFVSNELGQEVTMVDAATHKIAGVIKVTATPPATPLPMGMALTPDERQLLVALGRARSVAVVDVPSRKVVRTIAEVGTRPWGVALSPDGKKLYTANGPSGDVAVIDVASGKIDRKVTTGGSPWGVVVK